MTDNAVYTPNPKQLTVTVYRDPRSSEGRELVSSAPLSLLRGIYGSANIVRTEVAPVVGRGNLLESGRERYYEVELSDGSRHYVTSEGS